MIINDHPGQTSTSSSQPWRWTALGGTTSHTAANGQVHNAHRYHDGGGSVSCGLGGDDSRGAGLLVVMVLGMVNDSIKTPDN